MLLWVVTLTPTQIPRGLIYGKCHPDPNKQAIEVLFSHHKHLGIILDSKLKFAKHISQKISIARKGIGIIKYMSSYAPTKTLDKIFSTPHGLL